MEERNLFVGVETVSPATFHSNAGSVRSHASTPTEGDTFISSNHLTRFIPKITVENERLLPRERNFQEVPDTCHPLS